MHAPIRPGPVEGTGQRSTGNPNGKEMYGMVDMLTSCNSIYPEGSLLGIEGVLFTFTAHLGGKVHYIRDIGLKLHRPQDDEYHCHML